MLFAFFSCYMTVDIRSLFVRCRITVNAPFYISLKKTTQITPKNTIPFMALPVERGTIKVVRDPTTDAQPRVKQQRGAIPPLGLRA
jgi:hypothetical protein